MEWYLVSEFEFVSMSMITKPKNIYVLDNIDALESHKKISLICNLPIGKTHQVGTKSFQ